MGVRQLEIALAGILGQMPAVQDTAEVVQKMIITTRAELKRRVSDPYINQEGRLAAQNEIDEVYQVYHDMVKQRVETAKANLPPVPAAYEPANPVEFEAGAGRVWARIKGMLDAGVLVETLVKALGRLELRVLSEDYKAWAIAQYDANTAERLNDSMREVVQVRLKELWTPAELKAFEKHEEWKRGVYFAGLAVTYSSGGAWTAQSVLPTWTGATIQVPTVDGWYEPSLR